ncbi:MAG TPA: IS110 family transposase [Azospirillum sp.]|nr:IS110 family transposase [Azospirillum sp.]
MGQILPTDIIIGVDTHKHTHAAVAITGLGSRVAELTIRVSREGYRDLETWALSLGTVRAFGVEGTGSYGAGLVRALREKGHVVHEVTRPDRQLRHQHGKTDHLDAEGAARAVLGGRAIGLPKEGTSQVEMIRHLKVARDTAVKARTQAMLTLKALIVGAPAALREQIEALTGKMTLIRSLAAMRPGPITSTTASAKASLRAIARRWLDLDAEIKAHDAHLEELVGRCAPRMIQAHGIKTGTAAEMLILAGDNPERIRSEAAFAKLCGVCPIPASSGKTSRHRLNRGGHRQANAALYRVVVVRMRAHQPTIDYVQRRTAEGKSKPEIIRCLKRFVAREIFGFLCGPHRGASPEKTAACTATMTLTAQRQEALHPMVEQAA